MKAQTLRALRQYHLYVGMFFAPAILLFALSGALQTFRLQEEQGYGAQPPGWIVLLASLHKDQRLPVAAAPKPKPKPAIAPAAEPKAKHPRILALEIFVVIMSIGLIASAVLGITIALATKSTRRVSLVMLALGALFPVLLLLLL